MFRPKAQWFFIVVLGILLARQFSSEFAFLNLLRFGETWETRRHPSLTGINLPVSKGSSGYDGQFYAQVAVDPLLRTPHPDFYLDIPAYRARRILVPATAWFLGAGKPSWILHASSIVNILCWFALLALLSREYTSADGWTGFARQAGCLFSMGVLESVRQSLVDLPALVLLILAIRSFDNRRPRQSGMWLALGNLAKETNMLASLALLWSTKADVLGTVKRGLLLFLISTAPILLWCLYLYKNVPSNVTGSGLGNFTWPLVGAVDFAKNCLKEIAGGNFDSRYVWGLVSLIGFSAQALSLVRHRNTDAPWWRIGIAYAILLVFLGPWVWSGYWAACRAVLPLTIAFNLLLPSGKAFWPIWGIGNLTALHAIWRFL